MSNFYDNRLFLEKIYAEEKITDVKIYFENFQKYRASARGAPIAIALKFLSVITETEARSIAALCHTMIDKRIIATVDLKRGNSATTLTTITPFAGQAALGLFAAFRLVKTMKVKAMKVNC